MALGTGTERTVPLPLHSHSCRVASGDMRPLSPSCTAPQAAQTCFPPGQVCGPEAGALSSGPFAQGSPRPANVWPQQRDHRATCLSCSRLQAPLCRPAAFPCVRESAVPNTGSIHGTTRYRPTAQAPPTCPLPVQVRPVSTRRQPSLVRARKVFSCRGSEGSSDAVGEAGKQRTFSLIPSRELDLGKDFVRFKSQDSTELSP